ncbi:hypothetical protein N3K66_003510 [Trichothecium roseum]|uniref:Uncharacterized protein n=1 Tax=Trichothecium roseum TaxID=47278 RepID=A0ACC0V656_9HYPO|nr:hypothetical protein N3K66_003510 [Trichothecium roseum]
MINPRFAGQAAGPFRFAFPIITGGGIVGGTLYYRSQHKKAAAAASSEKTTHNKAHAAAKRDKEGLSGAGIGGTAVTGGHETGQIGSGVATATSSPDRKVDTDAPLEKLPSGGVGGGVGAGGANVRAIEMTANGSSQRPSDTEAAYFNMSTGGGGNSASPSSSSPSISSSSSSSSPSKGGGDDGDNAGDSSLKARAGASPTTSLQQPDSSGSSSTKLSASQRLQGVFGQGGASAGDPGQSLRKYHDTKIESHRTDIPSKRPQMRSDS